MQTHNIWTCLKYTEASYFILLRHHSRRHHQTVQHEEKQRLVGTWNLKAVIASAARSWNLILCPHSWSEWAQWYSEMKCTKQGFSIPHLDKTEPTQTLYTKSIMEINAKAVLNHFINYHWCPSQASHLTQENPNASAQGLTASISKFWKLNFHLWFIKVKSNSSTLWIH